MIKNNIKKNFLKAILQFFFNILYKRLLLKFKKDYLVILTREFYKRKERLDIDILRRTT